MKKLILILSMFYALNLTAKGNECYYYANEKDELEDTKQAFCVIEKEKELFKFVFYSDYENEVVERIVSNYRKAIPRMGGMTLFVSKSNPVEISYCDWDQPYAGSCHAINLYNKKIDMEQNYEIKRIGYGKKITSFLY